VNYSGVILEHVRELTLPKRASLDGLEESCLAEQVAARMFMRIQDANLQSKPLSNRGDWQHKIGIIGDYHRDLEVAIESIDKQMGGQIHIRSFFLCLPNGSESGATGLRVDIVDPGNRTTERRRIS